MNKADIYKAFESKISKTAIQHRYNEWVIKGKYCIIAPDDNNGDIWDIWICNPGDITAGLSQRKVKSMVCTLESTGKMEFNELTGEAWDKARDKEIIFGNLKLLGIRKKRKVTSAQC